MAKQNDKPLKDYEVLLCVTGGIAAYKAAELTRQLIQTGAGVSCALTDAAEKFITPLTFQSLTGRCVYTSLWQSTDRYSAQHISLTEAADLVIVAPATADMLAKMACGLADDLVSTLALSACGSCEILIAPAMNTRMFEAPPTRENLEKLTKRGVHVVGPGTGELACGTVGLGRMSEPEDILAAATKILQRKPPKSTS